MVSRTCRITEGDKLEKKFGKNCILYMHYINESLSAKLENDLMNLAEEGSYEEKHWKNCMEKQLKNVRLGKKGVNHPFSSCQFKYKTANMISMVMN